MSYSNKVVWSEGLFLLPQHFQQQERYLENYARQSAQPLHPAGWGFQKLTLDTGLLESGKVALAACKGIFRDGTPFSAPDLAALPPARDVPSDLRDQMVYLAIPAQRDGTPSLVSRDRGLAGARHVEQDTEVKDYNAEGSGTVRSIGTGSLKLSLLFGGEDLEDYQVIGAAHIQEVGTDKRVRLSADYIPPCLAVDAPTPLVRHLAELDGLFKQRAQQLSFRAAQGTGGVSEIANFLMLMAINRFGPVVQHMLNLPGLHPETLYRFLVSVAGELSTFTTMDRRPPDFPVYRHDDLRATFAPVIALIHSAQTMVIEEAAIQIPLVRSRSGIYVGEITDRSLFGDCAFVLAVASQVPPKDLEAAFPAHTIIGSVEQIRNLVAAPVRGVPLRPLSFPPQQLPFHNNTAYFGLSKDNDYWTALTQSAGIAIHVGSSFPGMNLSLWAIRA
ncbi:MAG: type VI secretion system baseplate subunit TssK [Alphaproteobacteria bacterium]|nr:type VI secretion system baseplate subunit TssK [Alphaproteobacteria bacterium]